MNDGAFIIFINGNTKLQISSQWSVIHFMCQYVICSKDLPRSQRKIYKFLDIVYSRSVFIKMVTMIELKGFEEFAKYVSNIGPEAPHVVFYFSGSKLPNGSSWCPDCVIGKRLLFIKYIRNH